MTEILVMGCGGVVVVVKDYEMSRKCPWCNKPYSQHRKLDTSTSTSDKESEDARSA